MVKTTRYSDIHVFKILRTKPDSDIALPPIILTSIFQVHACSCVRDVIQLDIVLLLCCYCKILNLARREHRLKASEERERIADKNEMNYGHS